MTSYRVHFALVEPHVDVGVHERLVDVDALLGVDHEHLGEQVAGLTRCQIWRDMRISHYTVLKYYSRFSPLNLLVSVDSAGNSTSGKSLSNEYPVYLSICI